MLKGFRDFLLRGNVVDLAVAVIIGVAFGAVVVQSSERMSSPIAPPPRSTSAGSGATTNSRALAITSTSA
jgi:large conductance mechanosensitive channel